MKWKSAINTYPPHNEWVLGWWIEWNCPDIIKYKNRGGNLYFVDTNGFIVRPAPDFWCEIKKPRYLPDGIYSR